MIVFQAIIFLIPDFQARRFVALDELFEDAALGSGR